METRCIFVKINNVHLRVMSYSSITITSGPEGVCYTEILKFIMYFGQGSTIELTV